MKKFGFVVLALSGALIGSVHAADPAPSVAAPTPAVVQPAAPVPAAAQTAPGNGAAPAAKPAKAPAKKPAGKVPPKPKAVKRPQH